MMKPNRKNWLITAAVSTALLTLVGCNDDDSDNGNGGGGNKIINLFVANDAGNNVGKISKYHFDTGSGPGKVQKKIKMNLAEGIAKDAAGHFYQAGNLSGGEGVVRMVCAPAARGDNVAIKRSNDRTVARGLNSPKGIAVAQQAGYVIVAESGADVNAVSVFGATAGAVATPVFSIPRSVVSDSGAWDVVYDEDSDKLFVALTNGDVAYYANYLERSGNGDNAPTNIFRAANALATSNMHGIVYVPEDDRLIVSDVAVPASGDDGSIYVFEMASTLSGAVAPDRTLRGPATNLGNPVDLQLSGSDLIVAEKANAGGRILVYNNIAQGDDGDIAADSDFLLAAPESILKQAVMHDLAADGSDLSDVTVDQLHVTSNAGGMGQEVFVVNGDLGGIGASFRPVNTGQFVESIALDQNGDAVISFDDAASPSTGGLSFISRLASRTAGAAAAGFDAQRDRQPGGSNVNLIAPKGVEVVGSEGVVMVADLNAAAPGAVKVFSLCVDGNNGPLFETTLPAGARPWDVDYDPDADRLFVASTDGTILVYDDYISKRPATPARTIDPDDKSGFAATNIHGIVHDSVNNRLIVSDVGSAAVADDGRIYVIENADTADGLTALSLELAGSQTALGNPVDLAFDGKDLFVAEKSNNVLQRIDDIYSLSGLLNRAPDKSIGFTAPESIAITVK